MRHDALSNTINRVRAELGGAVRARLVTQAAAAIGGAFWLFLALDRWLEPSPAVRLIGWCVAAVVAVTWGAREVAPAVRRRLNDREIVGLIASRRPDIADAAVTAIEAGREGSFHDYRLVEATRRATNAALERRPMRRVTRPTIEDGASGFALVGVLAIAALGMLSPDTLATYGDRLALSEQGWPRAVRLRAEGFAFDPSTREWRRAVAVGEPFELVVWADVAPGDRLPPSLWGTGRYASGRRFGGAFTRIGRPTQAEGGALLQEFRTRLEAVSEDALIRVRGGDGGLRLRLAAVTPPTVASTRVIVTPPDYLMSDRYELDTLSDDAVPEGSSLRIEIAATAPLASAAADITSTDGAASIPLRVGGAGEAATRGDLLLSSARKSMDIAISLIGANGVASAEPRSYRIAVAPDAPPTARLRPIGVSQAVTRDARIPLVLAAEDDHRVTSVRGVVDRSGEPWREFAWGVGATEAAIDLRDERSAGAPVEDGDRLAIQLIVRDAYDLGPPHTVTSDPLELRVVSVEELLTRVGERELRYRERLEVIVSDSRRLAYALKRAGGGAAGRGDRTADLVLDATKAAEGVAAIANGFAQIRAEMLNNRVDRPLLIRRLSDEVVAPLRRCHERRFPALVDRIEARGADAAALAERLAERLEAVLDRLEARESYNEVIATLRTLIREQQRVGDDTDRRRREQARRLLLD